MSTPTTTPTTASTTKRNENKVQTLLNNQLSRYERVEQHPQESCKEIFGTKRPDNWFILDNKLYIFECKCEKKQWKTEARDQLLDYVQLATKYAEEHNLTIIPVFVFGEGRESFKMLYVKDFETIVENETFVDFFKIFNYEEMNQEIPTKFDPHTFNNFIYNNFPNISSEDRIKIILAVLLTLSSNVKLEPPLALRCVEVEKQFGMYEEFCHLTKEPFASIVDECIKFFSTFRDEDLSTILFKCFVEISYWSFKTIRGNVEKNKVIVDYGAVFTPLDIVKLMVERLSVNKVGIESNDVVCDPCCGSGSFLYEALKHTSFVIGNDLDTTRVLMTRHGLLISKMFTACDVIKTFDYLSDEYQPKFDILFMNPAYLHGREQVACLKFMNLAKKGGAIIIPSSNFRNKNFKHSICKIVEPLELILLNHDVFHPLSSVETCILTFKSGGIASTNLNLKVFDFRNDGYRVFQNRGREFVEQTEPKYIRTITDMTDDWTNSVNLDDEKAKIEIALVDYAYTEFKRRYCMKYLDDIMNDKLITNPGDTFPLPEKIDMPIIDSNRIRWIKFSDAFQFITGRKVVVDEEIPLYGATIDNVSKESVNYFQYDSSGIDPIFTINTTGNGGCGLCFVMLGKFAVSSRFCFRLKDDFVIDINYEITTILMSCYLHNILRYSRGKGITKSDFDEIIPIYLNEGEDEDE